MNIGNEFWSDWQRDEASTDTKEHRVKYRVVEIVKIQEFGNYGKLIDAPRLEPLEVECRSTPFPFIRNHDVPRSYYNYTC